MKDVNKKDNPYREDECYGYGIDNVDSTHFYVRGSSYYEVKYPWEILARREKVDSLFEKILGK